MAGSFPTETVGFFSVETFFHSSVLLASYRVVAVKGNHRDALWQFHYARTRSGLFL
jgi:hypothetical protein